MPATRDRFRPVAVAARLLLKDLLRRRITLLLLFVVPALFNVVVLATTASRQIEVTLGTLVEDGAEIRTNPPGPFDIELLDNGSRTLDEQKLSLVFLGGAAVCFLTCFLAFNLVHKRREVDARLVLAGYRAHEVLVAKLAVLLLLVALLAVYEIAIIRPWVRPEHVERLAAGFFLGGLVYGCLGLLVGAVVKHELEGIFVIVLLTNIDVGWLQNPIYYAHSQRRAFIECLPGYAPTQLAVVGSFTDDVPVGAEVRALAYAGVVLLAALLAFGLRIRPAPLDQTARSRTAFHYAKVLVAAYALWLVLFEIVGRYAATLPTVDLTTALDRAIPVVPAFVWPYEACYAFPFLSLVVIRNWHRFNVALIAIVLANLTAFAVYLLVPVAFPHPLLGSSLSERILAMEYAADFSPGANKLPSMHVAMSWIMGCAMWRQPARRAGRHVAVDGLILALVLAITVSPLFVKQHIVLDVLAGVPWGLAAYWVSGRIYARLVDTSADPEDALAQMLDPRRWRTTAK
jgi:ABC-2 type transport system permease protein